MQSITDPLRLFFSYFLYPVVFSITCGKKINFPFTLLQYCTVKFYTVIEVQKFYNIVMKINYNSITLLRLIFDNRITRPILRKVLRKHFKYGLF